MPYKITFPLEGLTPSASTYAIEKVLNRSLNMFQVGVEPIVVGTIPTLTRWHSSGLNVSVVVEDDGSMATRIWDIYREARDTAPLNNPAFIKRVETVLRRHILVGCKKPEQPDEAYYILVAHNHCQVSMTGVNIHQVSQCTDLLLEGCLIVSLSKSSIKRMSGCVVNDIREVSIVRSIHNVIPYGNRLAIASSIGDTIGSVLDVMVRKSDRSVLPRGITPMKGCV